MSSRDGLPWCASCRSYHAAPRDDAHARALGCASKPIIDALAPAIEALRARLDDIAAERSALNAEESKVRRNLSAAEGRKIDAPKGSRVLEAAVAVAASAPAWTDFNGTMLWAAPGDTAVETLERWQIDYERGRA